MRRGEERVRSREMSGKRGLLLSPAVCVCCVGYESDLMVHLVVASLVGVSGEANGAADAGEGEGLEDRRGTS